MEVPSLPSQRQLKFAVERLAAQESERAAEAARLRQCVSDYEGLASTFTTLPERVERPIMVPFGKLALFKGTLRHTNEVTVLLGDNYFALRSAAQASKIALRRADFVREQLQGIETELKALGQRRSTLEAAPSLLGQDEDEGLYEIREEYNEEEWAQLPAGTPSPSAPPAGVPGAAAMPLQAAAEEEEGEESSDEAADFEQLRQELEAMKRRRQARGLQPESGMPQPQPPLPHTQAGTAASAFTQRVVERPCAAAPVLPTAPPREPQVSWRMDSAEAGGLDGQQTSAGHVPSEDPPLEQLVGRLAMRADLGVAQGATAAQRALAVPVVAADDEELQEAVQGKVRVSRFKAARQQERAEL